MADIFLKIINMSISASWLVLAVLLLRFLLKKAPKWINVLLWGIVAVRLVCPFQFESIFSLIPSAETVSKTPSAPRPHIESGIPIVDNRVNDYLQGHYFEGVTRPAGHFADMTTIWATLWVIGIGVLLIYTLVSYLRIRNKIGTAVLLYDNIWQSETVVSPFVLGVMTPKIYLPFALPEQEARHVIAHEQAHIARRDHLWKPLGFLILALHWFNPLLWLGYVLLCRDIELACDEKVVKELDRDTRADYSQALLSCSVNRRMIAACPLAFGEVGVKDRVKSVLNYRKPAFWIIVVAVLASVLTAVCFLTNPASGRLKNIEFLHLDEIPETTVAVWWTSDGESYYWVRGVNTGLLQELANLKISRNEISQNRSEERDRSHTLVLQDKHAEPGADSYLRGLYIHFNGDFTTVWVDNGIKPTLSYKVLNPKKANEIYETIASASSTVGGAEGPATVITAGDMAALKAKFPMYFDLPTTKGLEVYIWQLAEEHYACGLLPGRNLGYTNEELWNLHQGAASLDEMRAIVADYMTNGDVTKDQITVLPIQMPHSSYMYTIDEAYRQYLNVLFWSALPIVENTKYSPIIDAATFDIDGDGKDERCTLSHGPTSGLFTFVLSVYEQGILEYRNCFLGIPGEMSFLETEDGMRLHLVPQGEGTPIDYTFSIQDGNLVLEANGEASRYWGKQGVSSVKEVYDFWGMNTEVEFSSPTKFEIRLERDLMTYKDMVYTFSPAYEIRAYVENGETVSLQDYLRNFCGMTDYKAPELAWDTVLYTLRPGDNLTFQEDLAMTYGALPPGSYLLVKTFTETLTGTPSNFLATAPFTITE